MRDAARRLRAFGDGLVPSCGADWALLMLAGGAWSALAALELSGGPPALCAAGSLGDRFGSSARAAIATGALQGFVLHWCVMVAAMMSPLLGGPARHVARRSFRWRRGRAVALFLTGYLAVWTGVGLVSALALIALQSAGAYPSLSLAAAGFALAASWHASGWRRSALKGCHRIGPLAPTGLQANVDCFAFGLRNAAACVAVCWPIMAAVMLAPVALSVSLALASACLLFFERAAPGRPRLLAGAVILAAGSAGLTVAGAV